jgi:hypothetical protein
MGMGATCTTPGCEQLWGHPRECFPGVQSPGYAHTSLPASVPIRPRGHEPHPSAEVSYVAQPNGYGCAIACVAMIVGKSYDEVEAWLVANGCSPTRYQRGLWDGIYQTILARHGFSYVQRYKFDAVSQQVHVAWPPAPFAPVHIVCTCVSAGWHAVVMLADGSVLDPFKRERTSLAHPDYTDVSSVTGFYPMPADLVSTRDDVPTLSEDDIRKTLEDTARRNRGKGDH